MFSVGIFSAGPTIAAEAPPAADTNPATPNIVTAFVRLLRFEACFACDMVRPPSDACDSLPSNTVARFRMNTFLSRTSALDPVADDRLKTGTIIALAARFAVGLFFVHSRNSSTTHILSW